MLRKIANDREEPAAGTARLLFRLRTQGPIWIWRRLVSEWVLPTTKAGRVLHAMLRRTLTAGLMPIRILSHVLKRDVPINLDILYAFYDLKVEPITFDIVWFLAAADLERRRQRLGRLCVIIVPGPEEGLRSEDPRYEIVVDGAARRWRIHNVLLAIPSLLPSCTGFTLAGSREEAAALRAGAGSRVYPKTYEPALPVAHHPNDFLLPAQAGVWPIGVLRASVQALRYIDRWISLRAAGRRLVVITLREYAYNSARNSNFPEWREFARRLDPTIWWPVFVLDIEEALEDISIKFSGCEIFREATWNVALRMALYERAWLNLGVNNGPMALCWLNDRTRYITFKMVTMSVPQTGIAFMRSRGFEPNQSLPSATAFQKWVWEDDTLQVIEREFQAMTAAIELAEQDVAGRNSQVQRQHHALKKGLRYHEEC